MARAIRWTVPFVSQNGTACHVDIYQEGWTGGVTTLTGAADPFEYEEDDDEDLLNEVIRYRTGYLRVIEQNYGDLDDLYPSVNTDRYIEFYYGNTPNPDFNGYIQAQEFEKSWETGPRVLEFPIMSPMALADSIPVTWSNSDVPRWLTLREVIANALRVLNSGYTGFIFPKFVSNYLSATLDTLFLNSLVIAPWGEDQQKGESTTAGIFDPKNAWEVLNMICTGFGLILHDVPLHPIFQRVDHQGDYLSNNFSSTSNLIWQGITDMTANADVASDENVESVVMPLSKIEVEYDGEEQVPEMTFDRCRGYTSACALEDKEFCTNTPKIADIIGTFNYKYDVSIDANGLIGSNDNPKICLGAYGGGSLSEQILYRGAWETAKHIATYTFFEWNGEPCRLFFNYRWGPSIEDMNNEPISQAGSLLFYCKIAIVVKTGNKYYNPQTGWQDIPTTRVYTKSWLTGQDECIQAILPSYYAAPYPLVVEFYYLTPMITNYINSISHVRLEQYESASDEYLRVDRNPNTYTIQGSPSDVEGELTRGCGCYAYTLNRIRYNQTYITSSDVYNMEPRFPHLLQAQDRLQIDMKMKPGSTLTNGNIYLNRMTLWGTGTKKWRVVSHNFRPWDDIHRITFHHSPVFDY